MKMSRLLLFIVGIMLIKTSFSQSFSVSLSPITSENGTRTTLTCTYSVNEPGYTVDVVQWYKDAFTGSGIASILVEGSPPLYANGYSEPAYMMTRNDVSGTTSFIIAEVRLDKDDGIYECKIDYLDGSLDIVQGIDTAKLTVIVFPSSITLSDSTGASYPATGGTSYLVEGDNRQYTCVVPDINPGASFTWTVGSWVLPHSDSNVTDGDSLTTSMSDATLLATWSHHGQMLQCRAFNKKDHPGLSVIVRIDVKVPPKSSSMALLDPGRGSLGDTVDIVQGVEFTLTCRVNGTRPAATIKWFLNDVEQTTTTPTPAPGGDDILVDTASHWAFTPEKDIHRQVVKCEANASESKASVTTTLNVIGPPDTPVVSGNMGSVTMTENVATTLTWTADLGYPDDWVLALSNAGTAIGNPSETTSALSGTSQRYMFTSQLEFTPMRQDNTHLIACSASSPSWTSTPLPEGTWGPINVQYETYITNNQQTEVRVSSGSTANLSCTAKGNPAPVITWFDPNKTEIIHGGNDNNYMVGVSHTTSDTDMTSGKVTTSKLTIRKVDGQVDYGVYTCNSTNGIGDPDSHEINLNGTRRPNKPTGVTRTDRTSSSIAVSWTASYDGGEPQWFHVGYKKTTYSSEAVSDKIDGGVTSYNVDGLESYTEYDIRVYAENEQGRNPSPGSIVEYTLPVSVAEIGITIEFNMAEGTVTVSGWKDVGGCIQLEVKYEGDSSDWKQCGKCIYKADSDKVVLSSWCSQTEKRRRRATGDVNEVRASYCQGSSGSEICGVPAKVSVLHGSPMTINPGVIAGVVAGVILLVVIVVLVYILRSRLQCHIEVSRKSSSQIKCSDRNRTDADKQPVYQDVTEMVALNSAQENTAYANLPNAPKAFQRNKLHIVRELGHGNFGKVLLAQAEGILGRSKVTLVAVKTLKDGANSSEKESLIFELELMKKLPEHCNVVKLLGYCVQQDPPYIIVEYLSRGDLKELLKDSRSKGGRVYGNLHGVSKSLTSGNLVKFANDVADGMHFISSHKCIHRDLATRNVLVAEDMTCKVSDFGLARDVIDNRAYERQSQGQLPLRWMAMESVLDDVYTTESDVWSFGVLLWEIVTLGSRPYPSMSAKTMIEELQAGYRMPKPNHCQEELHQMMLKCWKEDPNSRPNFKEIGDELRQLGRQGKELISIKGYEEMTYEVTIPVSDQEKV